MIQLFHYFDNDCLYIRLRIQPKICAQCQLYSFALNTLVHKAFPKTHKSPVKSLEIVEAASFH